MGRNHVVPRLFLALAALLMVGASCASDNNGGASPAGTGTAGGDRLTPQIGTLPPGALKIMTRDNYSAARWTARVVNMKTGEDVLSLGPGSVVELNKLAGEAVDILVNERLIARGEVVVVDENFGVRVTEIVSPRRRAHAMGA